MNVYVEGFKGIAYQILKQAIDDSRIKSQRDDCMSFLNSDVFVTCSEILGYEPEKLRKLMEIKFIKNRKLSMKDHIQHKPR